MVKRLTRIVKVLIGCIFFIIDELYEMIVRMVGQKCRGRCVILYYHSIRDEQKAAFAWQMDRFRSLVTPVSGIDDVSSDANGRYGMITFDDGYESVIKNALPQLRARNLPCTVFIPTGSIGARPQWVQNSSHAFYSERVVNPEQISQLASEKLVIIGSHGVSHANSCRLSDDEYGREIVESKNVLEDMINGPVTVFSFPYGKYLERHLDMLHAAGYNRAFSIEPKVERPGSDKFLLGRIPVNPDDWRIEFILKLSGAYRWQTWRYRRKNNCG